MLQSRPARMSDAFKTSIEYCGRSPRRQFLTWGGMSSSTTNMMFLYGTFCILSTSCVMLLTSSSTKCVFETVTSRGPSKRITFCLPFCSTTLLRAAEQYIQQAREDTHLGSAPATLAPASLHFLHTYLIFQIHTYIHTYTMDRQTRIVKMSFSLKQQVAAILRKQQEQKQQQEHKRPKQQQQPPKKPIVRRQIHYQRHVFFSSDMFWAVEHGAEELLQEYQDYLDQRLVVGVVENEKVVYQPEA